MNERDLENEQTLELIEMSYWSHYSGPDISWIVCSELKGWDSE